MPRKQREEVSDEDEKGASPSAEDEAKRTARKEKLKAKAAERKKKQQEKKGKSPAAKSDAKGKEKVATTPSVTIPEEEDYDDEGEARLQKEGDSIVLEHFTLGYDGNVVLQDADLTISFGHRYALVGVNGSGKSTLMRAIAQRTIPGIPKSIDMLHVEQEAAGEDISALQSVLQADVERDQLLKEKAELEAKLEEFERRAKSRAESGEEETEEEKREHDDVSDRLQYVYDQLGIINAEEAEARAAGILKGLQFDEEMLHRPTKTFSGGWRMRIALARALFRRPALLLLDEPTNHLDLHACIWLETYLQHWRKTLIVVSHDREFMNSVCTDVIHIFDKKLHHYRGDYDTFERIWKERLRTQAMQYEKHLKAVKREQAKAVQQQGKHKDKKKAGEAKGKKASADSPGDTPQVKKPPRAYQVTFEFSDPDEQLPVPVLQVKDVSFNFPGKPKLFEHLTFGIDLDSRIALVGPNGVGKSTLMQLLTKELDPTEGEVVHARKLRVGRYAQHFVDKLTMNDTPIEYLHKIDPSLREQEVRRVLGSFGLPGKNHTQPIATLSGGQKARVTFAALALEAPHILFFDEPTNHLDLESIEALGEAMHNFKGGIVLISHDQRLIQEACNRIWIVGWGPTKVQEFDGPFTKYRKMLIDKMELDFIEKEKERERKEAERRAERARHEEERRKEKAKRAAERAAKKAKEAKQQEGAEQDGTAEEQDVSEQ